MMQFKFPIGYHHLHKTKIMDYQLNRWYSMGYTELPDLRQAARKIKKLTDWQAVLEALSQRALAEKRLLAGTFYCRAAEFFTHPEAPDKLRIYRQFQQLFYEQLCADEPLERHQVPFGESWLPALRLPPAAAMPAQGTLVIHGGFDSFMEELYSTACYFSALGYEVLLFEGPGQGAALKYQHLALDYAWERPAKAVLDYFQRDQVSWLGVSMGGWLCLRAAAFEPRIRKIIAWSIAYDYMQIPPAFIASFARWLMQHPDLMNTLSEWKMKWMPQEKWGIDNLKYITRTQTTMDAAQVLLSFNAEHLQSARVTQDVLILSGAEDHFIPLKMHKLQVDALTQARSLSERIFTAQESAQNHCQVGNWGLALEVMSQWLCTEPTPSR